MAYRHAALLAVAPPAVLSGGDDPSNEARPTLDVGVTELAGSYVLREGSAERLDFEQVELRADGTYVAKVDAPLVNPHVRTFGRTACTLPEEGLWNVYRVTGQTRLRVRPTTSKARVYVTGFDGGELSLARRGRSTVLVREALSSTLAAEDARGGSA